MEVPAHYVGADTGAGDPGASARDRDLARRRAVVSPPWASKWAPPVPTGTEASFRALHGSIQRRLIQGPPTSRGLLRHEGSGDPMDEDPGGGYKSAPERSAQMLLFLVSGRADALSGRFIHEQDNEEDLGRRVDEILRDDLHVLTLRT